MTPRLLSLILIAALSFSSALPAQTIEEVERELKAAQAKQAQQNAAARAANERAAQAQRANAAAQANKARLVIKSDADCNLSVNGESQGQLQAGQTRTLSVGSGEQLIECASTEVAGAVVEEVKTLVAGSQSVLQLKLADSLQSARNANRFAAVDQGFIRDSQTGLVWTQSDNGSDIIWQGARQYCASKGLELPSVDELRAIYDASLPGVSCGDYKCKVSKLFQLTNSWFWSATPGSGSGVAWGVYLVSGGRSSGVVSIGNGRALCVRRS